jgi:hypothetical protein
MVNQLKNKKEANAGIISRLGIPLLLGTGTSAAYDQMTYKDKPWDTTRAINFGKNVVLSTPTFGMARQVQNPLMGKALFTAGALTPAGTNFLVENAALSAAQRKSLDKNIFEKFNDLSPLQKTLAVAASGLTAAVAVPALMNLSSAAKRLAEGRAVRLSTSIRKRRNQDKDLVIGVQPVSAPASEEEPAPQQEESKGFLSKIFG